MDIFSYWELHVFFFFARMYRTTLPYNELHLKFKYNLMSFDSCTCEGTTIAKQNVSPVFCFIVFQIVP